MGVNTLTGRSPHREVNVVRREIATETDAIRVVFEDDNYFLMEAFGCRRIPVRVRSGRFLPECTPPFVDEEAEVFRW